MRQVSELSEDSHRVEKRRKALLDLKAGEVYQLALASGASRPLTPDPEDRATTKRHWDTLVTFWKRDLRVAAGQAADLSTGVPPAASLGSAELRAPLSDVHDAVPKAGLRDVAPQAPAALQARDLEALRGLPAGGAKRLPGPITPPERRSTLGVGGCRMGGCQASLEPVTKSKIKKGQPFLGGLARIVIFVCVAFAGLAADQLLFGDEHSPPEQVVCKASHAGVEAVAELSLPLLEEAPSSSPLHATLPIHNNQ